MARTSADIEAFINDLDQDEVAELVRLVSRLNALSLKDGKPAYTADEITLIQRFHEFAKHHPDIEEDEIEDGDIENS